MVSGELTNAGVTDLEAWKLGVTQWSAIPSAIICPIIIFITMAMMCKMFGKNKSIKPALECIPYILMSAIAFCVPYLICAAFLGPEFPSLIGGIFGLAVTIFTAKKGILVPKSKFEFPEKSAWLDHWKATTAVQEDESMKVEANISPGNGLGTIRYHRHYPRGNTYPGNRLKRHPECFYSTICSWSEDNHGR